MFLFLVPVHPIDIEVSRYDDVSLQSFTHTQRLQYPHLTPPIPTGLFNSGHFIQTSPVHLLLSVAIIKSQ